MRGAELVGLPPGNPIQKLIDQHLAAIGRADAQRTVFNFFGTLISMVEAGFGTAVMPTFALAACRRHRVRTDVLSKPKVGLDFYRITKRGAYETEALQAFAATIVVRRTHRLGQCRRRHGRQDKLVQAGSELRDLGL